MAKFTVTFGYEEEVLDAENMFHAVQLATEFLAEQAAQDVKERVYALAVRPARDEDDEKQGK